MAEVLRSWGGGEAVGAASVFEEEWPWWNSLCTTAAMAAVVVVARCRGERAMFRSFYRIAVQQRVVCAGKRSGM
jgi:hypothetical protein